VSRKQGSSRSLGLSALVSIGIGGMVGGGIFSVLGLTVQVAGAGAYLSFLVGGAVAALTGLSYARLSVVVRSRGGTAAFLDRAFGRRIAGPLNLLLWLSYFVMLGLYAVAFGAYLAALLGLDPNGGWRRILASGVIVCFAAFNLLGARVVGRAEAALVYFKLAVLLVFVVGGLLVVDTARIAPSAFPSLAVIIYAGTLIFLGYEGFELIANASEDARDPERTLPRAYLISIVSVIVLYVLVALVAVGNLTPQTIASERDYVLAAAARPFLGSAGFKLIAVAAVVSTASAINATLYGAAKFTYLMARHGELPELEPEVRDWEPELALLEARALLLHDLGDAAQRDLAMRQLGEPLREHVVVGRQRRSLLRHNLITLRTPRHAAHLNSRPSISPSGAGPGTGSRL